MNSSKSPASHYVAQWVGRLTEEGLGRTAKIGIAYAFSCDIHAQITAGLFTDAQVYRELKRHLCETPSRRLIRLHALPESFIKRVENHNLSGKKGASFSQLSYAMKLPRELQVPLLNESMNEELSFSAFQTRVDAATLNRRRRPTCLANQVNKVAKRLVNLLDQIGTDGFVKSLSRSEPPRRVAAIASLRSAEKHLDRIVARVGIAKRVPRAYAGELQRRDFDRRS